MKRSWVTLSQMSNGIYEVQDFERAAYRLVTEQVLYASDRLSRTAYNLIEEHFEDFASVLSPLGVRLERNATHRFIVALPTHGDGVTVSLDETLLLLILRHRYEEASLQGQIEEAGEVVVELPELQEAYPALTGREMPDVGQLRSLIRTLRRWGVCRLVESEHDDPQPFHLMVRPALVSLVGQEWLHRLDQHNRDDLEEMEDTSLEEDDATA